MLLDKVRMPKKFLPVCSFSNKASIEYLFYYNYKKPPCTFSSYNKVSIWRVISFWLRYRDEDKWTAFNKTDKVKWKCIKESFTVIAAMSKASSDFSEALCEAGIVEVVLNILSDPDIQDAYMRNKV